MLKGVTQGKAYPPRFILYGPPGIGKSTFGASSPSPIFLPTEDGIDNIPVDRMPRPETWTELLDNVNEVANGNHSYQTIVLDTLDGCVDLAAQHILKTQFGGRWAPVKGQECFLSFGNGWSAVAEEIRRLITPLDKCRERGMMGLLLSHTGVQTVKNPLEGDFQKYCPDVDRRVWHVICSWADIVGRADFDFSVLKPQGFGKGRAIGTSQRIVRFAGSAAEDCKTRVGFELPDTLPLSYSDFAAALGKDTSVVDEVLALFPILPKDKQEATYTWLGTRDLGRAPVTKLRELLNKLRTLAPKEEQKETENG